MAHVLKADYTPLSAVDIFVKDLGLVLDTARATKFPLPLASTAHQMFMQASTAGFAKEDDSAVIKIFPGHHAARRRMGRADGMTIRLGCIADDFTGATDLANNLVRAGMRTVQTIGVPGAAKRSSTPTASSSRSSRAPSPPADAVAQSLAACRWLKAAGATQIYFKVCSTFDSTPRGNIGPVLEALMDELDCRFTIATPAFPDNGRTVFKGHLFVGDVLLSDSGMRHHPLTPMTDANLVRVLQAQLATASAAGRAPRRVGLVEHRATGASPRGDRGSLQRARRTRASPSPIADAVDNEDLLRLGVAVKDLPLVCAGSGLAIGLPANFGLVPSPDAVRAADRPGTAAPSSPAAAPTRPTRRSRPSCRPAARRGASIRSRSRPRRRGARRRHRALGRSAVARGAARAGARLQHGACAGGRRGAGPARRRRRRRASRGARSPR